MRPTCKLHDHFKTCTFGLKLTHCKRTEYINITGSFTGRLILNTKEKLFLDFGFAFAQRELRLKESVPTERRRKLNTVSNVPIRLFTPYDCGLQFLYCNKLVPINKS